MQEPFKEPQSPSKDCAGSAHIFTPFPPGHYNMMVKRTVTILTVHPRAGTADERMQQKTAKFNPSHTRTNIRTCMLGKKKNLPPAGHLPFPRPVGAQSAGFVFVRSETMLGCCLRSPASAPSFPTPANLESDLKTRAQHLEDVLNMSGSARSRSHSTHVGKHRPPSQDTPTLKPRRPEVIYQAACCGHKH